MEWGVVQTSKAPALRRLDAVLEASEGYLAKIPPHAMKLISRVNSFMERS